MGSTRPTPTAVRPRRKASILFSAVAGVVTSLLLSFVPFSTVLGGFVAGYLRGGTTTDGAFIGGIVGLLTFAPFLLLLYVILGLIAFSGAPPLFGGIVLSMFLVVALYTVGASVAGGFLGAYLAAESDGEVPILDDL